MRRQCWLAAILILLGAMGAAQAQQTAQSAESSNPTIKKETKLVLVDTVVTDKKGNYVGDLNVKDFRVWEDNKEQPIKSFSSESSASSNADQRRFLVLFFDESTMVSRDQINARNAALKFLASNTGANRYIAVVDFGGALRVTQNFTTDPDRLKQAVQNLKFSAVTANTAAAAASEPSPGSIAGTPLLLNAEANFAARTLLLGVRDLAKSLAGVPGRKSLVLFSAGFPMNPADPNLPERESELTAAIDACNKANVAIYPIDVRGLVTSAGALKEWQVFPAAPGHLLTATFNLDDTSAHLLYVQRGGSGGGGGGGGGHGGTTGGGAGTGGGTGTHGGTGGSRGNTGTTGGSTNTTSRATLPLSSLNGTPNYYAMAHDILPPIVNTAADQQVLYQLADGTGGFVIVNSNDLLGGIQKIAQEQSQYYVLAYTPPDSAEGSCHTLRVKVDRHDSVVRSRSGYCNVRPADLLAGKPAEKQLEDEARGPQPGNVQASMLAPYFYTSANTARVNLAMEIPPGAITFDKQKGKQHAEVNLLGLAYNSDGSVAARFSDNLEFNFEDKKQAEDFSKKPYVYETQFDIGAGHYDLKVAFNSGGQHLGKLEIPLVIDNYDAKQFSMSAVALSKEIHPVNQMTASLDAAMLEDRTPLVTQGMQVIPAADDRFKKKTDLVIFYIEMYDPMLTSSTPPKIDLQMKVLDRKTQEAKLNNDGPVPNVQPGTPVVTLGVSLPLDKLPPGSYELELRATDSAGNSTPLRTANFELE